MTNNPQPVWQKKLGDFTLIEYPDEPNKLHCTIKYKDDENDFCFGFGSWGMDKESITEEDCVYCCQMMMMHGANVSISSFKSNLDLAENCFDDE